MPGGVASRVPPCCLGVVLLGVVLLLSIAFIVMMHVMLQVNKRDLAVKEIQVDTLQKQDRQMLFNEICVCASTSHPNLVEFCGTSFKPSKILIFTELLAHSLEHELRVSFTGKTQLLRTSRTPTRCLGMVGSHGFDAEGPSQNACHLQTNPLSTSLRTHLGKEYP